MKTGGGRKSIVNKQCQGWVCDRNKKNAYSGDESL